MSFPKYEKYKDSGVEWLGDVPEHWEVSSFRHCLSQMFNGLNANQVDEAENTVPVTRIETISYGVIDESKLGFINSEEARDERVLMPGDILFSNINSLNMVGKCAFYQGGRTIYAGMNLLVLRPASAKCLPLWLCWLVRSTSFRCVVESLAKPAINQASVSQSSINSITVAVPPLPEQAVIAKFLDRETAKIDELVAEQQRLIDLLKEKRQSVISYAVTRGLNPNVKLKSSGIEWIGDVPEHWGVKPLKSVVFMRSGEQITANDIDVEGPYPVFGGNGLRGFTAKFTHDGYFPLIGRQGALCGNINYGNGQFWASEHAVVVTPVLECSIFWLGESLRTMNLGQYSVTAAQPGLSVEAIGNLRIPFPDFKEQQAIADFITTQTAKFDTLTAEAQRAIDLLQERRTALISAAVTGKIDVRQLNKN